ncbi:MAG: SDR family NAD(P)-dependent oxidoreductase [Verrucomicrobiota bacterium]|jgi:NAD(P)-dependent dehydrogenase (short-subunit alcohol dehydrogenase family)|nr:SDR family NAD(P)-dependent oxidoreductase [Verrucomicrobiota bacterium]
MKRYSQVKEKVAVVTGASTGIGRATARLLKSHGWRVFPTARNRTDLDLLRGEGFQPVELDLADSDSVDYAAKEVLELSHGVVGAVVNNAGYGQPGALEDLSRSALRKQFETNVLGTIDFTNHFIPGFRSQGAGRIVLVSSVVGRVVIPFMGAYCASKFAIEAVGDEWRMELASGGISVSLVEPGPISTHFRRRTLSEAGRGLELRSSVFAKHYAKELSDEKRTYSRPTDIFRKPPEAVARKILHALEANRPKVRYPVTLAAWLGEFAARFFPARVKDWILTSKVIGREV